MTLLVRMIFDLDVGREPTLSALVVALFLVDAQRGSTPESEERILAFLRAFARACGDCARSGEPNRELLSAFKRLLEARQKHSVELLLIALHDIGDIIGAEP